jgi:hypothetical protein
LRSNEEKMGPFGAKLLTRGCPAWFNRASLISKGLKVVGTPFRMEEKEFLLTSGGQSGMNGFTASGFGVQSCVRVR